ncbi:MAG TPA: IucA/IucC family protein [Polyangiaceae bacterium]|nr:IucA/IucC family protein [Polyangiaceae bacterium]
MRQLVEALLFERIVPSEFVPRLGSTPHSETPLLYDHIVDFQVGDQRYRCLATRGAFDRVRVAQGTIEKLGADGATPATTRELVGDLRLPIGAQQRLLGELEQTLELTRWNSENLGHAPRRQLGFQELESVIHEGHQYHPCFKSRTGFSLQDHRDYGPEAGRTFRLEWLAVRRDKLRAALPTDDESFWRHELGSDVLGTLQDRMRRLNLPWETHSLLPVHPWQLRELSRTPSSRAFAARSRRAFATGELVPLGAAGDLYRASQSLRTLVNVTAPRKPHVKLPLDIVSTSSPRMLRPHFVCSAPSLSRWLRSETEADGYFLPSHRPLLLEEYAGILYVPGDDAGPADLASPSGDGATLEGQLGVVFRQSVCAYLEPGQGAVPFTALTLVEADRRPFVAEWLEQYGAERWATRLLEVTLLPLWHLLVHHGFAFESHAQNLVLIHRDGWPERIALRDFHEDTEFVPDYLRAPERVPDFAAIDPYFSEIPDDDGYRMADVASLRQLFTDCAYVFNLADVSFLLHRYQHLPEARFWHIARTLLDAYAASGVTAPQRIARLGCDASELPVESLLDKKIRGGGLLDYFEHTVTNTLRA